MTKIVTLDNSRVPFLMSGKSRILSFRSSNWKPDPGVVPTDEMCDDAGVEVVKTDFQHDHLSDRGPDSTRDRVRDLLAKFLAEDKAPKKPSVRKSNETMSVNYAPPANKN